MRKAKDVAREAAARNIIMDVPSNIAELAAIIEADRAAAGKEAVAKLAKPAKVIAEVLEAIDNRCMAADGDVTPTLQEATAKELRKIYKAADAIRTLAREKGIIE